MKKIICKILTTFISVACFGEDLLAPKTNVDEEDKFLSSNFNKKPIIALNFDAGYFQIGEMVKEKIEEKKANDDLSPVFVMIWGYNGAGTTQMSKLIKNMGFKFQNIPYDQVDTYIEDKTDQFLIKYNKKPEAKVVIAEGGYAPGWFLRNKELPFPDLMVFIRNFDEEEMKRENLDIWEYLSETRWNIFDMEFKNIIKKASEPFLSTTYSPRDENFWDLIIENDDYLYNPSAILKNRYVTKQTLQKAV